MKYGEGWFSDIRRITWLRYVKYVERVLPLEITFPMRTTKLGDVGYQI